MSSLTSRQIALRIILGLVAFMAVTVGFTVIVNIHVEHTAKGRIHADVNDVPHNRVGLLLGTAPLNRYGRPNSYFTNRIKTAAALYHAGKIDYIIASGDNHVRQYDEPTAMRDSLVALGVPAERIILDYAGFRTLDSVVRAKEVFGCDSLTIISQADHNARALYLAGSNGIEAVAVSAPLRAGRMVRTRLALREWLARDKMMLDILCGKQPHFLGEKITIPDAPRPACSPTNNEFTMRIVNQAELRMPVDSIVVEFENLSDSVGLVGNWFEIERQNASGIWSRLPYYVTESENGGEYMCMVFTSEAYIVEPGATRRIVNNTRPYGKNLDSGRYRITKRFILNEKTDTACVEFTVR